jgi:hypothetical protein
MDWQTRCGTMQISLSCNYSQNKYGRRNQRRPYSFAANFRVYWRSEEVSSSLIIIVLFGARLELIG